MARLGALSVASVVTLVLVACGGSDSTRSRSPSSSGAPSASSAVPTSRATTTTLRPAFVGRGDVFFLSPSKNIGCALNETAVRCDIRDRGWTPPPRPASCEVDFGQGLTIVGTSPASMTCAGDTAIVGDAVLDYGSVVTRGDFECRSETTAMRCRNVKSGHDFSLSREGFTLG